MRSINAIGEKIRKRRKALNIEQKDFAKKIGISPEHLSNIERGRRIPRIDLFPRIAQLLDMNYEDLLGVPSHLRKKARELSRKPELPVPNPRNLSDSQLDRLIEDIRKTKDDQFLEELLTEKDRRPTRSIAFYQELVA